MEKRTECDNADILIYGAGYCGAVTAELLCGHGIVPVCVFDQNSALWGKDVFGVPVVEPHWEAGWENALAVVCLLSRGEAYQAIFASLQAMGFTNIVHVYDFGSATGLLDDPAVILAPKPALEEKNRSRFDALEKALADEASKAHLRAVREFLRGNTEVYFDSLPIKNQYFAYDLYRRIPNETVLDAGGFQGEVMETFLRQHKDGFSFYHIVEPDAHYHCAILERAAKGQTNQIRLYSCALSDHREILRLRNYNNANSVV